MLPGGQLAEPSSSVRRRNALTLIAPVVLMVLSVKDIVGGKLVSLVGTHHINTDYDLCSRVR